MNSKRIIGMAALVALSLTSVALAAPKKKAPSTRPITFKLATIAPDGSSLHKALIEIGDKWKAKSKGQVTLKIYPGGAQGGEADVVRRMRTGQLEMALLTAVGLSEIDPSVEALQSIPMMFRSLDEVDYVGQKLRPRIQQKLREHGYVVLVWGDMGWVRFFSKTPVIHPADLKKLKLFTWAGDPNAVDIYKKAGFKPIPLETADILPMLRAGMIEAVPYPPYVALTNQVFTTATHMLEIDWAPLVGALVVNEKDWNKLSPERQKAFAIAAAEVGRKMQTINRAESDKAVVAMQKRKLQVHPVTPDLAAEWRVTAEASWPEIRGRIVPADLFDEVQKTLAEYRAAKK